MTTIGLTGSFGSGKTTALASFRKLGAKVLSCDELVHSELRTNAALAKKIKKIFGQEVFKGTKINRQALAGKVFKDKNNLTKLNALIHPLVKKSVVAFLGRKHGELKKSFVVVEVPLLFEAGFDKLFDINIGIAIKNKIRMERLLKDCNMSREDINSRTRSQMPIKEKLRRCDFVIDNSGNRNETFEQVKKIMEGKQWKN